MVGVSGFEQSPPIKILPFGVHVLGIDDWVSWLIVTHPDGKEQ